jgi:hypothetical protein
MKKLLFALALLPGIFSAQVKSMDIPFTEYAYDNSGCNGFRYGSGSLFFIPADAFINEDGSNCTGKITVKYRELHTRADMLVSGINMILVRNNKRKMLESAGMFEIIAECNGKPMKLAPGKTIQVRMKCMRNLANLQAFVYDRKNRSWLDAGVNVIDLQYKAADNNANNVKLWGSGRVPATTVTTNLEEEGYPANFNWDSARKAWDSIRVVGITNIVGNLPDGYIKGMDIKALGIYNYDAVIKDEQAVPILAKFVLRSGEEIKQKVYVGYTSKNTLIYYYPDDLKERFVLLPEKGIRIFVTYDDGSVAVMKESDIDALNIPNLKGKEFTFTLDKLPAKPKDKPALAEATKIN